MSTSVDPARCPLCGEPNACALASPPGPGEAAPDCWCRQERFPQDLLARVPPAARERACICRSCLEGARPARSGS